MTTLKIVVLLAAIVLAAACAKHDAKSSTNAKNFKLDPRFGTLEQQESLAIVGEHSNWDASNDPHPPEPPHIFPYGNDPAKWTKLVNSSPGPKEKK